MKVSSTTLLFPAAALLCLTPLTAQEAVAGDEGVEAVMDGMPEFDVPADEERRPGEVPAMFRDDAMLDDSHSNQELGINVYTAPSISKIFAQLDNLPAIPEEYVLRRRSERMPTDTGSLALEMGYLMADGFIAVRSGHMNDIKPIALDLTRYGKAMGVGERMNTHSASLLENAEKGQLERFKQNLAATQEDVNAELTALRDPDLAHLIALGGWIRALDASAAAIENRFDVAQAATIFYADAPEYFEEVLGYLNPQTANKLKVARMRALLREMAAQMKLTPGEVPTLEKVRTLHATTQRLSTLVVGKGYEN